MKKKLISISAIILIIALLVSSIISYANTDETIYVNLTKLDQSGFGYGIGDPSEGNNEDTAPVNAYIWNIATYDSEGTSVEQRNLYCLKADYGQSWNLNENTKIPYNLSYDLQKDRQTLIEKIIGNESAGELVKTLLNPGTELEPGYYREILWILDNAYIKDQTDKITFLDKIGIKYDSDEQVYFYEPIDGYDYNSFVSENSSLFGYAENHLLTESDIIAVQRAAIWYYTNYKQDTEWDAIFNQKDSTASWLTITSDGETYTPLSSYGKNDTELNGVGAERFEQAQILYNYLIDAAEQNAEQYKAENNYQIEAGLEVDIANLTKNEENDKYKLATTRNGSNYIVGPIIINKNIDSLDEIAIEVTNQVGAEVEYTFTDAQGNSLETSKIKDLIGRTEGFYITVSRSSVEKLNIKIDVTHEITQKTLWLKGTDETAGITVESEQPIVEITRTPETITTEFESEPEEFDLALRKYITAVHNKNGEAKTIENPRSLNNITLDTLVTGTTATYKHRKDPVIVEENDEVTYTIRIYNEGNKAGYAKQIVDQLPTGLIMSNEATTVVSKDKDGNDKNTYTLSNSTFLTSTNQIILDIIDTEENPAQSLEPYTTGNLDYETIEIKCKVIQEPDTVNDMVLTNVAWISIAYDSETQTEILTVGQDRDSEPQTLPKVENSNVNKSNMENYKGNTINPDDLTNDNYFYEGQQDDDDFEKLILKAVPKKFDLALVKFITAISDDETIEEDEYLKNADGTYSRAPEVKFDSETGEITYDFTNRGDKNPLMIEPGDYVLYTIRVYNEGELDGYASKIKDELPEGLKFVNNEFNAEYLWNLEIEHEDGKETVSTEWFAKGKGAETGAVAGDANYNANLIKAFNPESEITEENPDYIDAQILCMVEEQVTSDRVLVNYAQISEDSDENGEPIDDIDSIPDEWNDGEDDQDIEKVQVQCFDLSLRKFISTVNGNNTETSREPDVDVSNLVNATGTTAIYNHPKTPVGVEIGDTITYTIRVYNEGDINGFASEVKDYLPPYLTYAENSEINTQYGWQISENGRIATTTHLANSELKAFDGTKLSFADLKIECIVSGNAPIKQNQTNIAEISEYTYNGNKVSSDIDSTSNNMVSKNYLPTDENLPIYNDEKINNSYIPGNEDDDDFEKIYVKPLDLSLRKFVTSVNGESLGGVRVPVVDVTPLKDGTGTTAIYKHPKTPVSMEIGDKVTYTIRVYNEGEASGYANEVKDYLPPYLEFVKDSEINTQYGWSISEDGRIATTSYLSNKKISGFNGTELDFEDILIECKISNNAKIHENITNIAEISEYKYGEVILPEDIDSKSDNIEEDLPTDENLPTYNDEKINDSYVPGNEDDDDFEKIYVKPLDLSLRKFVTSVNGESLGGVRVPAVDITPLKDGTGTTAIYKHPKTPVSLKIGDKVTYTIRVYNEGEASGYANEVKDYLPPYLKFVKDSETNTQYGWSISEDGRIATTSYLSNKKISGFNGTELDFEDIQIECKISNDAKIHENITNIAEISEYKYGEAIIPEDIDSKSDNINEDLPSDEELPKYNDEKINDSYVPGNEDDDDFEKIYVKQFDLALKKFITQVQDKEVTTRIPEVKIENGVISYNNTKEPITLHVGDIVTYTLRIYNEGEISGYASEVTDDIPEHLEYLPTNTTNVEYMWEMYDENGNITENVEEAVKVKTTYLSKENGEDNLISAFDGTTLSYKEIKIAFKVKNPNSNTQIITNYAQISDDTDKNGMPVEDKDSRPDEWNEGEDDQDIENVKVEYFDLALLKFVSKVIVIENGKETITETGYNGHENPEPVVKVELHKKKLDEVVVKFGYGITITNEGDIPGYATEITDYIPEGLKFEAADNPLWIDEGNNVISTKQLEGTLLQPGESATVEVVFTWINGANNLSLKTNTAEISNDKNEYDLPDRDSTPDNKVDGEDDIDIAKVILTIITGSAKTYFTLAIGLLTIVLVGIVLIKKFVI